MTPRSATDELRYAAGFPSTHPDSRRHHVLLKDKKAVI
jgi:hypothetical protein